MLEHNMTAKSKKMQCVKFFIIVFASTVFAVFLHQVHHDPLMTLSTKAKSVIITSEYFPPAAFAGLAMAFCIMGLMSLSIVFGGLVFGINWVIFNLFALLFIRVPVLDLLYRSIFDSIAIIIGVYILSFFQESRQHYRAGSERQ